MVKPSKIIFLVKNTIPKKEDRILLYIGYHSIIHGRILLTGALAHALRYCKVRHTKTARHPSPSSTSSSEILRGVLHGELALPRSSAVGGGGGLEEACFRDRRVLPHLGSGKLPPACRLNEARERDDLSTSQPGQWLEMA